MLEGLDHLNLAVPEGAEPEARAFYGGLLGLREVPKPQALRVNRGCWFKLGALTLHLGVDGDFSPAKAAHPAFLVSDLAAVQTRLEAAGYTVTRDARVPHVRRFFCADPFGNRLEFIQAGDSF